MTNLPIKNKIEAYFNNNNSKILDGLSYSSGALFLSSKIKNNGKYLIIIDNNDTAEKLYKELSHLLSKEHDADLIFIPETEEMPYDMVDSDKYLSSKKNLQLINFLNTKKACVIAITTINNIIKKTLPRNFLENETLDLKLGYQIDINNLRKKLINIGYINNPQVNFHGELSIRGSIIDIFPGGYHYPIRIDLNDTTIESIKFFKVDTQITFDKAVPSNIYVVPTNDTIVNDKNIVEFRKNYRKLFEGNPINSNIYTSISNNIIPQGFNNYFSLLYKNSSNFFDYFNNKENVIIFNSIRNTANDIYNNIESRYNYAIDNNELVLSQSHIYLNKKDLFKNLENKILCEIYTNKNLSKESYSYNISAVPDISLKPYQDKPINDLYNLISASTCIVLFGENDKKITQLTDIFKSNNIEYTLINSLDDINLESNKLFIIKNYINESFKINELKISFISHKDVIKEKIKQQPSNKKTKATFFLDQLRNLEIGSPVVHEIHGVGRYDGLKYIDNNGYSNEYLTILYEDNDKLYVPVSSLHLVNKYHTLENETAPLHKLGGFSWQNAKKKATKKAYDVAAELVEINAKRALRKTIKYNINNFEYEEFINEFIYDETDDQISSIEDVISDLCSEKLMDRLVCGDVGFGKTEIALRAAFICASNFKQVVVLAPTTLLAEQHEKTFKKRFKNWPFKIHCLSRFKNKLEQNNIISEIKSGDCNIVIGTHRVIQKDIVFKSLGLVIVDEEQKFGVRHKEFLKKMRNEVNVLTLTATPIPRTLNMSLGGLRDLSIIATSPENRMPIKTYTSEWKNIIIKEACDREINRGGQVFFLHNRVNDINLIYNNLQKIMPNYSIKIAHAQMSSTQLEKVILEFYNKKFNILLSTTIIENGIDIANANTIIINKADKFGLSQLHQIRGRVGRSNKQAFCYLLVPDINHITDNAKKRLQVLETMEDLGSGFSIASRDLEIRGAGTLLGESQSGEIQEIGFSLYNRILSKAISSIKSGEMPNIDNPLDVITEIDINEVALIPESYIHDINQRLIMYKKIANIESTESLDNIIIELINRFGSLPNEVNNLIDITKMKIKYSKIGIKKLTVSKNTLRLSFQKDAKISHKKLIKFINNSDNNVSFTKENILIYKKDFNDIRDKKIVITNIIESIK